MPTTTVASVEPEGAATVLSIGQEIVGGAVSGGRTVTTKVQVSLVSEVEVTVLFPTGKNEPEEGDVVTVPQVPEDPVAAKLT